MSQESNSCLNSVSSPTILFYLPKKSLLLWLLWLHISAISIVPPRAPSCLPFLKTVILRNRCQSSPPSIADPIASHNLSALSPLLALSSHRSNRFLRIKHPDHFSHFLAFANTPWMSWNYFLLPQPFWVALHAYCMPLGLQQRSLESSLLSAAPKLPFSMGPQDLQHPLYLERYPATI